MTKKTYHGTKYTQREIFRPVADGEFMERELDDEFNYINY